MERPTTDRDRGSRAQALLDQLVYWDGKKLGSNDGTSPSLSASAAPSASARGKRKAPLLTATPAEVDAKVVVCRPWSREDLLRRLRTYSTRTWFCKLDQVSAIACASRGWVNSGVDTLECESCKARAIYPACASASPKDVGAVAEKFAPLLDSLHDKFCPWKGRECEPALLSLPLTSPTKLLDQLKARMHNLCTLRSLPRVSSKFLEDDQVRRVVDGAAKLCSGDKALCEMLHSGNPSNTHVDLDSFEGSLLLLGMCGWDQEVVASPTGATRQLVLTCAMCGSRAGVWNFDSWRKWGPKGERDEEAAAGGELLPAQGLKGAAGATGYASMNSPLYVAKPAMTIAGGRLDGEDGERAAKAQRRAAGMMHPLHAHKKFCPWRCGWIQTAQLISGPM